MCLVCLYLQASSISHLDVFIYWLNLHILVQCALEMKALQAMRIRIEVSQIDKGPFTAQSY
jgi:hypothetical protein